MTRYRLRTRRHAWWLVIAIASVLVIAVGTIAFAGRGKSPAAAPSTGDPNLFVTRSGTHLMVGNRPLQLVGLNYFNAAATPAYSCPGMSRLSDGALRDLLQTARRETGATVLRFWAYQTYTRGGTDWSGVDRVLRLARAEGMRVLPVLEDGPGDCTYGTAGQPKAQADGGNWYLSGYRAAYGGAPLSYRDYVAKIVEHYAADPTILGWTMINEGESTARDNDGRSQLVGFASDISSLIRSIDRHHLITVGTQSNGAAGASGPDFKAVYGLPDVDFAEVHDYAFYGSDSEALPGGIGSKHTALPPLAGSVCTKLTAPIACSFAIARDALHKPIIVGEAGIKAGDASNRSQRATEFNRKIDAAFQSGASAYVVWQLGLTNTDGYGVLLTDNDPLVDVLRRAGAH